MERLQEEQSNNQENLIQDIPRLLSRCNSDYPQFTKYNHHKIAIAPMIDVTNTHFRFFMRLFTKQAIVYTEMIHCNAILRSPRGYQEILKFSPVEHPIVCQLGGCDPVELSKAAKLCEIQGYDEINLNVGCPSPRVQAGSFGACLMKEPELVANIMKELSNSVSIPCTVKCRLGVDDFDSYEFIHSFIQIVSEKGGVKHFIIHARKAFLKGLNPKQNRNVPPLNYDYVKQLKKDFPEIKFSINGGFKEIEEIQKVLDPECKLEGCMLGRLAYDNPFYLSNFDRIFFGTENPGYSRREILQIWGDYGSKVLEEYPIMAVCQITKPIINLFVEKQGNKQYKQFLSERENYMRGRDDNGKGYKLFINGAIDLMEQMNKEVLDYKPK